VSWVNAVIPDGRVRLVNWFSARLRKSKFVRVEGKVRLASRLFSRSIAVNARSSAGTIRMVS